MENIILQDEETGKELSMDKFYLNEGADAYQKKDYETAVKYYRLSAEMGNITALSNLGYCYYYGRSIPVDKLKAKKCWEKAAILGDIASVYKLGDMYRYGDIPQNLVYSHALYKRAFEMALNCDDDYVFPDAFLRMLKYYPNEISNYGYSELQIATYCINGIKRRIDEGDIYSEKVLKDIKEIIINIVNNA